MATGKAVWSTPTPVTALPKEQQDIVLPAAGQAGNMAATPVCDGERVYAVFAIGIVAAFDLKTGQRLWTKTINAPLRGDGRSGSPVRAADLVLVQLGELYAFDAKTGAIRWKQDEAQEGYGTPLVTKIGADEVVLLPKGTIVRVSDGKLLASLDALLKYASPCLAGNKICFVDTSINIFDLPEKIADPLALNLHWSDSLDGEFYTTPLFHGGLLYTLETHGKLSILDVKNKTKSEKQLELEEIVYPSPVLAGKYIFVGNNKGKTIVLEPGKDAKIVKINELGDGSGATPAFSGKKIFIRSGDDLFCIEGK
jgi:outer membrane protein assembly factor BamB